MTNIVSECRSANIVRDHAMILPDDATPKLDGIFGKDKALRTWLRFGEIHALRQVPIRYDKAKFRNVLKHIRALTNEPIQEFCPKMTALCKESGVIFVLIPSLPKTCLSGAAFWTKGTTPVIQQSLRHKTNDRFWFTFFHEAGHILLHNPKAIYADDENGKENNIEKEANDFATEMLVGLERFQEFKSRKPRSAAGIIDFSKSVDIHPGIVVGMLQHHGVLEWSQLNFLKTKFEWKK
jgi:hypothetical protein